MGTTSLCLSDDLARLISSFPASYRHSRASSRHSRGGGNPLTETPYSDRLSLSVLNRRSRLALPQFLIYLVTLFNSSRPKKHPWMR